MVFVLLIGALLKGVSEGVAGLCQVPPPARQHAQADVQGPARPRGEGEPAAGAEDQHQAEARLHGRGLVPGVQEDRPDDRHRPGKKSAKL